MIIGQHRLFLPPNKSKKHVLSVEFSMNVGFSVKVEPFSCLTYRDSKETASQQREKENSWLERKKGEICPALLMHRLLGA